MTSTYQGQKESVEECISQIDDELKNK
jgi:hypothetical protein